MSTALFPIAILAGGLATRLRPITETIPKALITLNGEPFIAHQLRLLYKNKFRKVVICVSYLGEQIVAYVGDGTRFGLEVSYSFDGPTLLGTAGAIKKALPLLGENFFVIYGDSYLPCDYASAQEAFLQAKKLGLMTIFKNDGKWDKSNVEYSAGEIQIYDKKVETPNMHYIDYGLGLFDQKVFAAIAENKNEDLVEIYQALLNQKQLAAYEVKERFYEVGSFSGIEELSQYLLV
jgi:N-acetyl-alpha-D-muramate 1-phosphate uridylyltransferase